MPDKLGHVCVVSFKECWQNDRGEWFSLGGFPLQMAAIDSLFDEMTLLITCGARNIGGIALPAHAKIVPLRLPVGKDTCRKLFVLVNLFYYLRAVIGAIRQADVVHTPLPGDIPLLGMLGALVLRKPLIARYGGSWANNTQTTVIGRLTKSIMRWFAGGRNIMLATGEGQQPPAPRMHWIFASALARSELEQIHPILDRSLSNPPRLIYAGRLSPEKGVRILIEALARLKQQGFAPMPHLVLAGDGPQRQELERMVAEFRCADTVQFTGQLNRSELSEHFLTADVCVQPSLTEGFSKAWLDAMAHGVPVVASRVGAAPEVIGANSVRGWVVPPGDVDALATALALLLSNSMDWCALRQRCASYAKIRTVEDWAQRISAICAEQWTVNKTVETTA